MPWGVTEVGQTCWYCGTSWLSPMAIDAMAEEGACLTCGFDLDHPRFRQEACGVFRVEPEGGEAGLVLEALNDPARRIIEPAVGDNDPVGRRLEAFAAEPDVLLADARLALDRKGVVTRRTRYDLRSFPEAVDIVIEHRALAPGRVVIAAWLLPAAGADGTAPQVSSSAA
jgi:hypothetical protein